MKKIRKFLLVLALVPFIFSGCSLTGSGNKTTGNPIVLTVWQTADGEDVFRDAIKEFESANSNVKVEISKKNPADYEVDSLNALASQKGPDIWSIRNDWMTRHADKLVPAAEGLFKKDKKDKRTNVEVVEESFVPVVGGDVIRDKKVYGLPLAMDTLALLYNDDLFKAARKRLETENSPLAKTEILNRAPQTWDEFIEAVKALGMPAAAIGGSKNTNRADDLLSVIMLQDGTEMTSADAQTAAFNLPGKTESGGTTVPGLLALNFYTSFALGNKGYQAWDKNQSDSLKMFIDGKLPMVFGYARDLNFIKQAAPKMNIKTAALPQVKGATEATDYASYWIEAVTKSSKNPALAWDFIKYLATSYASTYQSATGLASALMPQSKVSFQDRAESNQPFKVQPPTAKDWNKGPEPTKVDRVFSEMIDNVLNGLSSQVSLDNGATQVTDLLRSR